MSKQVEKLKLEKLKVEKLKVEKSTVEKLLCETHKNKAIHSFSKYILTIISLCMFVYVQ